MAERQIIRAGSGDFLVAEDPGWPQRIGPGFRRLVMPVRHCHLPAGRARPRPAQWRHIEVIPMCMPPYFEIIWWKSHGLFVSDAENVHIRNASESTADEDRVNQRRIVIPRQDHDR